MNEFPKPRILFEDQHLVVLSKAPGALSQGDSSGQTSLVDWLRGHFGRNYVGMVHRLDRNTSGLMVFAKRSKAAERLTQSLQSDTLKRVYRAIVLGELPADFEWRDRLLKDAAKNLVRVVKSGSTAEGAKDAILSGRRLERKGDFSLGEFLLETGRSHQIRVQAATRGFPILGDSKYGNPRSSTAFPRTALHSCRIEFPHPMRPDEILSYEDDLWDDMKDFWNSL